MESHSQMVERLRAAFRSGVTVPEEFRRTQLTSLMSLIKDNEDQISKVLHQDLAKVHRHTTLTPQAVQHPSSA